MNDNLSTPKPDVLDRLRSEAENPADPVVAGVINDAIAEIERLRDWLVVGDTTPQDRAEQIRARRDAEDAMPDKMGEHGLALLNAPDLPSRREFYEAGYTDGREPWDIPAMDIRELLDVLHDVVNRAQNRLTELTAKHGEDAATSYELGFKAGQRATDSPGVPTRLDERSVADIYRLGHDDGQAHRGQQP